jgi:hypothetical protein
MIKKTIVLMTGLLFLGSAAVPAHAETWHTSRIENIYPLADGGVVVIFVEDAPACTGGSSDKYHHIRAGEFGVTTEGVRNMLATLLFALASDRRVSYIFDETSSSCYINRLITRND